MNLNFSTQWPKTMPDHLAGNPTEFPVKILKSLETHYASSMQAFKMRTFFSYSRFEDSAASFAEVVPKPHTIREDKSDRWKAGVAIHFYIHARTKKMFQFAPIIPCVSTQKIEIKHDNDYVAVLIDDQVFYEQNYRFETQVEAMNLLCKNDGFETKEDFFAWFNKDFTGKIIHWTDLKY